MIVKIRQLMEMAYINRKYRLAAAIAMLSECDYYDNNISGFESRVLAEAELLIANRKRWENTNKDRKAAKMAEQAHTEAPATKTAKRFVKPTVEQVAKYCRARGNSVNAHNFCDFYEAKGWRIGPNSMKDWKAAVRTWEQRDQHNNRRDRRGATPPPQEQLNLSF